APTLPLLIAARAAQGLGAAVMMAPTIAFVGETVPKERTGSAMGLLGTMSAVGTALGPSLGGVLIVSCGWRSIFLVNAALGVAAMLAARRFLPVGEAREDQGARRGRARFDTL
ncbi:MFS transporter, partial [bacterium M00.F.Ca.ET.229.01.1.1]